MISKIIARALGLGVLAGLVSSPVWAIEGPFSSSYRASELRLENLAGRVVIEVGGSNVTVAITGKADELAAIEVTTSGAAVTIESSKHHRRISGEAAELALFKISVPKGTDLSVDGLVGEAEIGDLGGDLKFEVSAVDAQIGDVSTAALHVSGSGDIGLGNVAGELSIEIAGSGSVEAGNADSAQVSIAGSGDVKIGDVRHGLKAEIAGSGDIQVKSVNGPVRAELAGSGDVSIGGGRANPLSVEIIGSGDFDFGGEAVDPEVSVMGSGSVTLGSYTGKLKSHGNPNLTIGK
jgi:hypothetical protein